MEQKRYPLLYEFYLFLLCIFLINRINSNDIKHIRSLKKYCSYDSYIDLVIQGTGVQKILSEEYKGDKPYEVLVYGIKKDSCVDTCILDNEKSNITLKFKNELDSCDSMFYNLNNIIVIDLSNFNASLVTTMYGMFYRCKNLEKIYFGNINTSSLENMKSLFNGCSKLTSV